MMPSTCRFFYALHPSHIVAASPEGSKLSWLSKQQPQPTQMMWASHRGQLTTRKCQQAAVMIQKPCFLMARFPSVPCFFRFQFLNVQIGFCLGTKQYTSNHRQPEDSEWKMTAASQRKSATLQTGCRTFSSWLCCSWVGKRGGFSLLFRKTDQREREPSAALLFPLVDFHEKKADA